MHLYFTMTALFAFMEHQGAARGLAWLWNASRAAGIGKGDQNKWKKWMWCPSVPKHWGCREWEVAKGATGCIRCQGDGSQGAWSTFQFQHLKWCWDKLLSAVSLNICSAANKGIKSFLLFQIHNLGIKANNWRYTNTEISIPHRLNDPCCRSWKEPLVRGVGWGTLCVATSSIFCALIGGKLVESCSI